MARGTTNTTATFITGDVLPAATENDANLLISSADDDALYDVVDLEPPFAATTTNVAVGFMWRKRAKAGVLGDTGARTVHVDPVRAFRSSTSNFIPRAMLSGVTQVVSDVALGAAPAAGNWKIDLVYAQLAYVNPSEPSQGTVLTIGLATQATEVLFANAPTFASLPANTASPPTWYVPIAYVKNNAGVGVVEQEDILEIPPTDLGDLSKDVQMREIAQLSGVDVRRAFAFDENAPQRLTVGGPSIWVDTAVNGIVTNTITPVVVAHRNTDYAKREFLIPACKAAAANGTSSTNGVIVANIKLDDTRDWRGANFRTELWESQLTTGQFAEEDPSATGAKVFPAMKDTVSGLTGAAYRVSIGQSWNTVTPDGAVTDSRLWAAVFSLDATIPGSGTRNGVTSILAATDAWGIIVDPTTGVLHWWCKRAGVGVAGPAVWIMLEAWFSNHLPL